MTQSRIHPGDILAEEIAFLGMTVPALARELDLPVHQLEEVLNDERGITADLAQRLSGWLGTSPDLWLMLQSRYE